MNNTEQPDLSDTNDSFVSFSGSIEETFVLIDIRWIDSIWNTLLPASGDVVDSLEQSSSWIQIQPHIPSNFGLLFGSASKFRMLFLSQHPRDGFQTNPDAEQHFS